MRDGRVNAFSLRVLQISHVKPAVKGPPTKPQSLASKRGCAGCFLSPRRNSIRFIRSHNYKDKPNVLYSKAIAKLQPQMQKPVRT